MDNINGLKLPKIYEISPECQFTLERAVKRRKKGKIYSPSMDAAWRKDHNTVAIFVINHGYAGILAGRAGAVIGAEIGGNLLKTAFKKFGGHRAARRAIWAAGCQNQTLPIGHALCVASGERGIK